LVRLLPVPLLLLASCAVTAPSIERRGIFTPLPKDAVRPETTGSTGKLFTSGDEAATQACAWLWTNIPKARQWEYCGAIYQDPEGIKAGIPVTRQQPGKCTVPLEPSGTKMVGEYHNHRLTEVFSEVDVPSKWAIGHYLCTPSGGVLKYTAEEGTVKLK